MDHQGSDETKSRLVFCTHCKRSLLHNLAAMLKAAQAQTTGASLAPLGRWESERSSDDDDLVQIMLVAGAGFEPATFGL